MPFIDANGQELGEESFAAVRAYDATVQHETFGAPPPPDVSLADTAKAAFRRENIIVSTLSSETLNSEYSKRDIQEGYNVIDDIKGTKYEDQYGDRFIGVYNKPYADALKLQIDQEEEDMRTLAASGGIASTLTMIAAGVADPLVLVPGTLALKAARGAKAAKVVDDAATPFSLTRSGVASAGVGAGIITGQEAILHMTQELRTPEESLLNISAGTIVAGMLGTAVAKGLNTATFNEITQKFAREMTEESDIPTLRDMTEEYETLKERSWESVGAARSPEDFTLEDLEFDTPAMKNVAAANIYNPVIQSLKSPFLATRKAAVYLADSSFYLKGTNTGKSMPISAESMAHEYTEGLPAQYADGFAKGYKVYREDGGTMTPDEFAKRVTDAANNGDKDPQGNMYVEAVVEKFYRPALTKGLYAAQKEKLLPENPDIGPDKSYSPRVFDQYLVESKEVELREMLENEIGGSIRAQESRTEKRVSQLEQSEKAEIKAAEKTKKATLKAAEKEHRLAVEAAKEERDAAQSKAVSTFRQKTQAIEKDKERREGATAKIKDPEKRAAKAARDDEVLGERGLKASEAYSKAIKRAEDKSFKKFDAIQAKYDKATKKAIKARDKAVKMAGKKKKTLMPEDTARFANKADLDAYIKEQVEKTVENIKGGGDLDLNLFGNISNVRGPLKARTLNLPYEKLKPWLETDSRRLMHYYGRMIGPNIVLKRTFGSVDMKEQIDAIKLEAKAHNAAIDANEDLTPAQRVKRKKKLNNTLSRDVANIQGMRDRLLGVYKLEQRQSKIGQWLTGFMAFNTYTMMAGVTASSMPDIGRHIMVHGTGRFINQGLKPLINNMSAFKASTRELKIAGASTELVSNNRMAAFAGFEDAFDRGTPLNRFRQRADYIFSRVTGIAYWNQIMKDIAGNMTQTRVLENAEQALKKGFDSLDPKEQKYMSFMGFGRGDAEALGKYYKKYGQKDGDLALPNTLDWAADGTDARGIQLAQMFRAAVNKDIDSIIVTKGIGDTPLMGDSNFGRALLQFKHHMIASHNKVVLRGMSEDKTHVMQGAVVMAGLGMLRYMLHVWQRDGDLTRLSDNPAKWILEGIDRGGLAGTFMEWNNYASKIPLIPYPDVYEVGQALFPSKDQSAPASRYAQRNVVGSLLGPSFGQAEGFVEAGISVRKWMSEEELTYSDKKSILQRVPLVNTLPIVSKYFRDSIRD